MAKMQAPQYRALSSQTSVHFPKTTFGRRHKTRGLAAGSVAPAAAPAAAVPHPRQTITPGSAAALAAAAAGARSSSSGWHDANGQPLEPRIQVAVSTTNTGVAKAVLLRLRQLGHAEVWATSAANHFIAVSGVALAAQQLQHEAGSEQSSAEASTQQQQDVQQPLAGLAATARLSVHDQPVKDDQKRRLNKLELFVQLAEALEPGLLSAGQEGSISTNRTTNIGHILGLMQQVLLEPIDDVSSRVRPGAVCVVEARGEQAVTRALKAALSLQAAAGQDLLLRPIAGKVVDIVAEKRGQSQLADGLLLLFTWTQPS